MEVKVINQSSQTAKADFSVKDFRPGINIRATSFINLPRFYTITATIGGTEFVCNISTDHPRRVHRVIKDIHRFTQEYKKTDAFHVPGYLPLFITDRRTQKMYVLLQMKESLQ